MLTRSRYSGVEKARGSVPTRSEGHDHAVTLRGEHWRNFDVAMDVVRVAVQKQDLLPVARTGFVLSNPSRSRRLVRRADLALRPLNGK